MGKRLYLDRIEGDQAVVVAEDDTEQHIAKGELPPDAVEGTWLVCEVHRGKVSYQVDLTGTQQAEQRVQSLMDELSSK